MKATSAKRSFDLIRTDLAKETGNDKVTVPTIKVAEGEYITDSWAIAEYVSKCCPMHGPSAHVCWPLTAAREHVCEGRQVAVPRRRGWQGLRQIPRGMGEQHFRERDEAPRWSSRTCLISQTSAVHPLPPPVWILGRTNTRLTAGPFQAGQTLSEAIHCRPFRRRREQGSRLPRFAE